MRVTSLASVRDLAVGYGSGPAVLTDVAFDVHPGIP